MRNHPLHPRWLAQLHASVNQPPTRDRVPFYVGPAKVGSVEPAFLEQVVSSATRSSEIQLRRETNHEGCFWPLLGEPTKAMALLANVLHDFGLAGVWRDEQLGVTDLQGKPVGSIERAAVRPLGITTLSESPCNIVYRIIDR
jgi:hypothetical protein